MNTHNNILISVIIPCYNCEQYLNTSLGSIIKQNCKDVEIILIDDGSTDNSLTKAKSILCKSDIEYKIIKQKNQGVSVARNIGIDNAVGEYIYFLDADDYIQETLFNSVKKIVDDYSPDSILFGYNRVKSNGNIIWKYENDFNYVRGEKKGYEICKLYLNQHITIHLCSVIVKRKILIENNIKFRVNCYYGEDIELFLKAIYFCNKVLTIPQALYMYYNRENSAITTFSEKRFTAMDAIIGLKEFFINEMNCKDVEFKALLDVAIAKEVIYIYISELFFNRYKKNQKEINKKISTLINEYKHLLKEFILASYEDKSLKKVAKFMIVCPKLYAYYMKMWLKIKNILRKVIL